VERALRALAAAAPDRVEAIVRAQSLQRVALPELDLRGPVPATILKGCDLTDARLQRANLTGLDLSQCRLENTRLQGSDLSACRFDDATLVYTDFAGADLRGATGLAHATIEGILVQDMKVDERVAADLRTHEPCAHEWSLLDIT